MSDHTALTLDAVIRAIAEVQLAVDPWRAFVGLIGWHETKYADVGRWYVLSPKPLWPGHEARDSIVLNPDTAEDIRALLPFCKTDAERAAFLWYEARMRDQRDR